MLKSVVLVLCVVFGSCSRILVVFPVPSKSHSIISDSIVKILLDGGHNVTYVSPSTKLKSRERLNYIKISSEDLRDRNHQSLLDVVKNPQNPREILEKGVEYSKQVLQNEEVQELLSDFEESYDAVLAEWYYSGLLAPLAALYGCPLIWYTCEDISWVPLQIVHEQTNPAYAVDSLASNIAVGNNIWSRAYRLWRQICLTARIYYTINYVESPAYHQIYQPIFQKRAVFLPDYESVLYNGSLMLINSHPAVGQNSPLPNNAKYVGGHHIEEPVKLLPQKLQEILDNSTKGIIIFSLGTDINTMALPLKMKWKLMDVFGELDQTVIWKVDEYMEDLPQNVLAVKWMPQKNILNHTNTLLVINQGGFISNIEAAYFGVPVISVPFYGDQLVSADLMVAAGRGMRVDFCEEFPLKIKEAINVILGNNSYRRSAHYTSTAFKRFMVPPAKELRHWVDLVISTQGAYHLRSPALQLTMFERLHLDIVALLIMFLWFLSKVLKVVQVHMADDDEEEKKNK
ncbi:hypothetical protein K1T71_003610 [Dendrolimus kikuchii]|uniref:Uncharacterized protein n=1 Tax=Dendrolimus kikuchii TaxID=765133 RepID=A0ACC1D8H6_9NEOP|nr:hypothetical protein K1T71_003610 [Dendrolimus kikuchii]